MRLLDRKPRPLKRTITTLRDDRLFIIACDDKYAPKQYFDAFKITRIQVHVIPTDDGSSAAKHVLSRLEEYNLEEDDERWLLLDTDHCVTGTHIGGYTQAIQEARQKNISIAISKPCFEVWLLLHHLDDLTKLASLDTATKVEKLLRKTLGAYNKTNLQIDQYSFKSVAVACAAAVEIDSDVNSDIPISTTSRVHKIWEAIASKALKNQLPEEIRHLAIK